MRKKGFFKCLAFGEVTGFRHGFEFLVPNWGPVNRLPNVFRLCIVGIATSSSCACLPTKVGGRVKLVESGLLSVLSSSFPRRRIEEVKWCNVGPSRFIPFRIPNHLQPPHNSFSSACASLSVLSVSHPLSPAFFTTL